MRKGYCFLIWIKGPDELVTSVVVNINEVDYSHGIPNG